MLNASKLGIYHLHSCSGIWSDMFHERFSLARGSTHQLVYPPYKYIAANEMQGNIIRDAAVRMIVG